MSKAIKLSHPSSKVIGKIAISGSKSESNRLLVLKALYFDELQITGLSDSRDTDLMKKALATKGFVVDVGDAGTVMRFLTAYFAVKEGVEVQLKGTDRMHQRPIGILVDALRVLGAEISYIGEEGYPPLQIKGKKLEGGSVHLDSSVSSQFITALMLIAPSMPKGLDIYMKGFSVSAPYIYLTTKLMQKLGFRISLYPEKIFVFSGFEKGADSFVVEPDWSSASYWYLIALLAKRAEIYLPGYQQHSLQGDAFVSTLFEPLGLDSHYIGSGFRLKKNNEPKPLRHELSLIHNPDLAQTLAVALAAMHIPSKIKGLQTLKIKETDRLVALKTELEKTGAIIEIGDDFIAIKRGIQYLKDVVFETYDDHRMAMSFAPLALLHPIVINGTESVVKSYQFFWKDLKKVGFVVEEI